MSLKISTDAEQSNSNHKGMDYNKMYCTKFALSVRGNSGGEKIGLTN